MSNKNRYLPVVHRPRAGPQLTTGPIISQKHGGALIRAGALNSDNTVNAGPADLRMTWP